MKVSTFAIEEEEGIETATGLVTREVKRKRAADEVALQKTLEIAREIEVPTEVLLKESSVEAAHKVIKLTENLQQLIRVGDLLDAAEEVQRKEAPCSEAVASKATRGKTDSHNISNIIEIESSSTLASHSTSVSTSSDIDNIPLSRVYANLHKSLSPHHLPNTRKSLMMIHMCLCIHLFLKE